MSLRRSASSFSTLRERRISPEASSTHAQWKLFPASMPVHTLGEDVRCSPLPPPPFFASLRSLGGPRRRLLMHSESSWASPISISGRGLLKRGRGAIPFEPSDGGAKEAI